MAGVSHFPPSSGWSQPRGKFPKVNGKPLHSTDEIVYSKGGQMESMPSLSKQLEGLDTCVIGLKYVWEYRSPSMTVAPLYNCKLCNVHQFQGHMIAHIAGWKHAIRYITKEHPDKITFTEEDITKDPTLKKTLKEITAELVNTVGIGQLKVIMKEPSTVPAFKTLFASSLRQQSQGQVAPAGPPPARGGYRTGGFGGYASLEPPPPPPHYSYDQGNYYKTGHYPERNEYEGYDYDQSGSSGDYHEYRPRPMIKAHPHKPEGGDLSNTLLSYLDTFKIENESDAQLVLKVTQKLTDILMEYRLRGGPKAPNAPPEYIPPNPSRRPGFPSPPPRYNEPFPGYKGPPPRYSGAPARY